MSKFDELLNKEMTRKQFLGAIGIAVVSFLGFSSIIGLLTQNEPQKNIGEVGYGDHAYGP